MLPNQFSISSLQALKEEGESHRKGKEVAHLEERGREGEKYWGREQKQQKTTAETCFK